MSAAGVPPILVAVDGRRPSHRRRKRRRECPMYSLPCLRPYRRRIGKMSRTNLENLISSQNWTMT
ncbi:hypothetical protein DPMN_146355 [Dreissena polymorpha]|uniref:Uncharacterized protein n=1 Tax=Dreissena polymorpha TaxID=45954 RepID=A0A9D4F7R5_DREPO|nr:hypothetical protein DPMN_146355 [Dreissena polymorpha]